MLADIRALGGNSPEEDQCFATVARVSEINQGLYRTFVAPAVQMMSTQQTADFLRRAHPNRLRFEAFVDSNPFMAPVAGMADAVRAQRQPCSTENPLLVAEHAMSESIVAGLEAWTRLRDTMLEAVFFNAYGSPLLQAMVGLRADQSAGTRRIGRDLGREMAASRFSAELKKRIDQGGLIDAIVRALIYVRHIEGKVDERGFTVMQEISEAMPPAKRVGMARFKEIVRDQFLIVQHDEERAVETLPRLLPDDPEEREAGLSVLRRVLSARGSPSAEAKRRLQRIEAMFAPRRQPAKQRGATHELSAGE
jgi:Protein of unknown function (DUF3141)